MEKSNKNKIFIQIFKFVIIGGIAFAIDSSLLYIFTEYFNIYYLFSSILSFSISVIFNYIASVKWVFDVDQEKSKTNNIILFIVMSILGLLINQVIMWFAVEKLALYYMISKIIATFVVMVWNFVTRKIFLEKK